MNVYLVTAAVLIAYLVGAWFVPPALHLQGRDVWLLRIGLAVIGVAGAGAYLWFYRKQQGDLPSDASDGAGGPGHEEIDGLIREAEARLAAARVEGGAKLNNLPAIFLIGQPSSTKTSTIIHSGLEPELLAGQVFQDNAVIATRTANLWFTKRSVFVEAAGKLVNDPSAWQRLVRRLRPGKLTSVGKGQQAPRAVLVCFDAETFLKPAAVEAVSAASRALHARLQEVSQALGIRLPVYVLFTRIDRLTFFNEYVRNLSNDEITQVLGVTLPLVKDRSAGVYAEQEGQRLSAAFHDIYYSLCDKRSEYLVRERDAEKLPGAYEFPREFRKLRGGLVQFMVDLCRPSQLAAGPFLRGFYFSGVRPVFVNEPAPAAARPAEKSFESASEATGFFRAGQQNLQQAQPAPQFTGPRKVPQWVFLTHLFNDVLLADRAAMGASGASTQTNTLRRALLVGAGAVSLLLSIAFLVSYFNNRQLVTSAREAAQGISAGESSGMNLASVDALKRLETLRQSLETLGGYEREGAPWSLRWGLYTGSELYPDVRRIYFNRFHQLLFGQTQAGLLATLQRLPATPGPGDEYGPSYDTLKAYLITTSHHDKSTKAFLSPVLLNRWSANRNVDPERLQLARKQFDFYSDELKAENPYSTENDAGSVERARRYLKLFGGIDRVYQAMLTEAGKTNPPINFHQVFPTAAEVVIDRKEVGGAFTKGGWAFMQNAFRDPSRYFAGEQWVLGDQGATSVDAAAINQLRTRYQDDFIANWRAFLKSGSVVRYQGLKDAATKLKVLGGPSSPLLQLFSLVSQHTTVGAPEVDNAFKAAHAVVPSGSTEQYIGPGNNAYMGGLVDLQISIDQIAGQSGTPNDAAAVQSLNVASAAKGKVGQMALTFGVDPEAGTVRQLLEAPIIYVEPLLRSVGPAELNAKGRQLCAQFRPVMSKYPFSPNATAQATVAEVNSLFRPKEGALWAFYDANLPKLLARQGTQFTANSGGTLQLTSAFVGFFNRAAAFSDGLYPGGVGEPRLAYTLKPVPTEGIPNLNQVFQIDGQTLAYTGGNAQARQFVWPGPAAHQAVATVKLGGQDVTWSSSDGLWAVFQLFGKAERQQGNILEWVVRIGRDPALVNGRPLAVRLDVEMTPPLFQKNYFSGLACVADVAR